MTIMRWGRGGGLSSYIEQREMRGWPTGRNSNRSNHHGGGGDSDDVDTRHDTTYQKKNKKKTWSLSNNKSLPTKMKWNGMGFVSIYLLLVRLLVTAKQYGLSVIRCFLLSLTLTHSLSLFQPSHDDLTALAVKTHTHTLAFLIVRNSLTNCCKC